MFKILGVGGSPRKNGNSDRLLKAILKGAAARDVETEAIFLRDYSFSGCIGCEKCRKDGQCKGLLDGMQLIYPKIDHADALVLASPTYNYNITAPMKAFIDRLYCYYIFSAQRPGPYTNRLKGKTRLAAVTAVYEQTSPEEMGFTIEAMKRPLEALGFLVIEMLTAHGIFKHGAVSGHKDIIADAEDRGLRLAERMRSSASAK
jgi:multimeric flavodoxin WrbA